MITSPWFVRKTVPSRRFRIYCFSYAGGNASNYSPWQAMLGPDIEVCAVQLPGRGNRFFETHYDSLSKLIEDLAYVISQDDVLPFAFFGHSLGGLIAFELARYLERKKLPPPRHLFVSGSNAPQYRSPPENFHLLPDDALIQTLRNLEGTPSEILDNESLMELVLPTIRADFALAERYHYYHGNPLSVPITVLVGKLDSHTSNDQVDGWQKETSKRVFVRWFEGGHFFINEEKQAVLECVAAQIRDLMISCRLSAPV